MELLLGGVAACGAGFFTNPLEVAKTRMQLQGELQARGKYAVHYKNVVHAFYTIGRVDGLLALQKGLVPALWYQFFMNGLRLGAYQMITNAGLTKDKDGNESVPRCIVAGAISGCVGACVGSPFYMLKTHMQAAANESIAVGYQHTHKSTTTAIRDVYKQHGVRALWRGVTAAIPRVMVGSGVQLSSFSTSKQYVENLKIFKKESFLNPLAASMLSGVVVVLFMTPFDVVSTRMYNQGTDAKGRGLYYTNIFDCFTKILRKEGLWGFYKGWGASLFRLGPHTVLSLMFWTEIRKVYKRFDDASHKNRH